jgi:thioredoxin-like negative regulator of GroEL
VKKIMTLSIIVISAFIMLIVFTHKKEDPIEEKYYQNQISFDQLQTDLLKKDEKIIYFYRPECKFCEKVSPIVIPMAKEMKMSMEVMNIEKYPQAWDTFKIQGTPTIIHYRNGKERDRVLGAHEKEVFKEWFEKIKKE